MEKIELYLWASQLRFLTNTTFPTSGSQNCLVLVFAKFKELSFRKYLAGCLERGCCSTNVSYHHHCHCHGHQWLSSMMAIPGQWDASGQGKAGRCPLYIALRLSFGAVSKNQHITDPISHLQSSPADDLIFLTGLKSSIIQAPLTSLFLLPDEHCLDLTPHSFLPLGVLLMASILPWVAFFSS